MSNTNPFFPKVKVPFERKRKEGELVATPSIRDGYEWVFENTNQVHAVEKLNGENLRVDIDIDSGEPMAMYKRDGFEETENGRVYDLQEVPLWSESHSHYAEGVVNAYGEGWIDTIMPETTSKSIFQSVPLLRWFNREHPQPFFGELVGPKVQGNKYGLDKHYWVPFKYAFDKFEYESYGNYGVEFEDLSEWFVDGLIPLFYSQMNGGLDFDTAREQCTPEGVVFIEDSQEPLWERKMAKLRRSDFEWYYE